MTELIEIPAKQKERLREQHSIQIVTPSDQLFNPWLEVRQEFMETQGWHQGYDFDEYDQDLSTIQLLNIQEGQIESGLRLTPRDSIEETMTWSWLPEALQVEARKNLPELQGQVWDLTRLVPGAVDQTRAIESLIELFGAGFELTGAVDGSPRWVFATTVPFYRRFNQQGIEFTMIARGRFSPTDKHESVFCFADPLDRTDFLNHSTNEQFDVTRNAVARGRAAMSRTEIA